MEQVSDASLHLWTKKSRGMLEIGEAVKQKFLDLIDAKVVHRVSCPSSESDGVSVNPHQLPPLEGDSTL